MVLRGMPSHCLISGPQVRVRAADGCCGYRTHADDTLQAHPAVVMLQNAPQHRTLAIDHILTDLLRGVVWWVMVVAGRPTTVAATVSPDSLAADVLEAAPALKRVAGSIRRKLACGQRQRRYGVALAASQDDQENGLISTW